MCVGCNYIGTENELGGCINDARRVKDMLVNTLGYPLQAVRLLHDDATDPTKQPTKTNIIAGLNDLIRGAKKGDTLFFHYSGHGSQVRDTNKDETDGKDETLVPIDFQKAGMITDDYLRTSVANKVPSGVNFFAVIDACHSASVFDLKYNVTQSGNNFKLAQAKYLPTNGNVVILSGCVDNSFSYDVQYEGEGAGAMTVAFRNTILSKGANIDIKTLIDSVRKFIKSSKLSPQIPQLSCGQSQALTSIIKI